MILAYYYWSGSLGFMCVFMISLQTPSPGSSESPSLPLSSPPLPFSFSPSSGWQESSPIFYSTQPLGDQHLLTRQRINGKNCLHRLENDSWHKHYKAISGLKQVTRAEKPAFEKYKHNLYTVHKNSMPSERIYLAYTSRSQSIFGGSQDRNSSRAGTWRQ